MASLLINKDKISSDVIPNIKNANTYISNAKTNVASLISILPQDFSSRSTVLNIKSEIEYLNKDIEKMLIFFKSKVSNIENIDSQNFNRLYSFADYNYTRNIINSKNTISENDGNYNYDFSDYSDEKLKMLIEACTEDASRYKREGYLDKEKESLASRKKYETALKKRGIFIADKDTMANQISGLKEDIKRYKREGYDEKATTEERRLQALEVIYSQLENSNKIYYSYSDVLKDKLENDVITTCDFEKYSDLEIGIYEAITLYPEACDDSLLTFKALEHTTKKDYDDLNTKKQSYLDMVWNFYSRDNDLTDFDADCADVQCFQLALLLYTNDYHNGYSDLFIDTDLHPLTPVQHKIINMKEYITVMSEEEIEHCLKLSPSDVDDYLIEELGVNDRVFMKQNYDVHDIKVNSPEEILKIATQFLDTTRKSFNIPDFDKLNEEIVQLAQENALISSISFEYENSQYKNLINSTDFDKYADDSLFNTTFNMIKDIDDSSLDYSKLAYYMTEDERKAYAYQLGKYGKIQSENYLTFLKDELRSRCGLERAKDTLKAYVQKDENGNVKTTIIDGKEYPLYDVDGIFKQIGLFGIGTADGVQTFGEGLINAFAADGEKSSFDYEKVYIIQLLNSQTDNKIFTSSIGYELGSSVGNMLPPILASLVTQNPTIGRALMGVSAYGNNKEELLQQGYDGLTANFRAAIGSLTEVGLEAFLGSIPGISTLEGSEKWICKVISEGTEESVQCVVDALFDTAILGKEFSVDFNELVKSGIMGMFSSGIINAPRSLYVTYKGVKTKIDVSKLSEIYKYDNSKLWNSEYNSQITESMIKYANGDYKAASEIMSNIGYKEIANNILSKAENDINIDVNIGKVNDVIKNVKNTTNSIPKNVLTNDVNSKLALRLNNLPKSMMGFALFSLPYIKNRFIYRNTNNVDGLNNSIKSNGLYHFTSESNVDLILKSENVKASSGFASYGNKKSFFFNGIPEVGNYALNLDSVPLTTTAVKIMPTDIALDSNNMRVRIGDDGAITWNGNFNFKNNASSAKKVYLALFKENGNYVYKEVSESVYRNYNDNHPANVDIFAKNTNKDLLYSFSGKFLYDVYSEKTSNSIAGLKSKLSDVLNNNKNNNISDNVQNSIDNYYNDTLENETVFFGFDKLFKKDKFGIKNTVDTNLTSQQLDTVKQINEVLKDKNKRCLVKFQNTSSLSSLMLDKVTDLSRISVEILDGLDDGTGSLKQKYQGKQRYNDRVTYSGYEAKSILQKIEYLQSKVDLNLAPIDRAKQVYDILAAEIPVMRDYASYKDGHLVAASLRGLTDNNIVGKEGLVCAGYASVYKELCERVGVKCDYIRGKAILDPLTGAGGGHAWNVVHTSDELIPVDVTWHACDYTSDWFGGSQKFADTHKADFDETYIDYSRPLHSQNFDKMINEYQTIKNVIEIIDQKYGTKGYALTALKRYIETGNINYITRTNDARNMIASLDTNIIISYLNQQNNIDVNDIELIIDNNIKNTENISTSYNVLNFDEYNAKTSNVKTALSELSSNLVNMYEQGRMTGKSLHDFLGYEEHNFLHVSRVANASVQVLDCLENLINQGKITDYGKIDRDIVYESGLAHDLGMKISGYMIDEGHLVHIDEYLSKLSSKEIVEVGMEYRINISDQPTVQEIESLRAAIIRKQHPLNSAIEVLKNRQVFSKNPELIACLTFIHSKSSSQVKNISSIDSLSAMVKKIYYNQVEGNYTFDISKLVEVDNNGKPRLDASHNLIFKNDVLLQLKTGAVALRVGDAHAEKTGFNHGGGKINVEILPDYMKTINEFLNYVSDRIDYGIDDPSIGNKVSELCDAEASNSRINIEYEDGKIIDLKGGNLDYSRRIVLGERNVVNGETTVDNDGNLVYTFIVKSENSPACTWVHGIEEKFGEYATFKDIPQKVIVKLPNNASPNLINFYNLLGKNSQASRKWLTIEIQS